MALSPACSATRERLADLLWTDRGPEQARASLRQCLKELRELRCTGEAITTTRNTVELDEGLFTIDLREIRDAARRRDFPALAKLLDEVRGDLLEDLSDLAPAFDEWLQAERPLQRDLILAAAIDALEAMGLADMKDARSILRSLDRLDPVNEAIVRLGMRFDHEIGDGASLHRRYRRLCDLLESEFDTVPSEETRALFHSLAVHGGAPSPPRPAPPAPTAAQVPAAGGGDMVPLVMVAPLQTHGVENSQVSLAEFCADDIRVSLSRNGGIQVLALDDSDASGILEQSEDALGIYMLSGNLRQIGTEVRVNLRLVNAASRIILWSDSLRFRASDEEMIDTIVGKAAGAALPAIDRDLSVRLLQTSTELDDERAMYTRARLLIRGGGKLTVVQEGVRLLEELIERNPLHLGARLLLVRMYNTAFWQQVAGHDAQHFRETAERHLQAAARIEPCNCEVRNLRAWCHLRRGEITAAKREFDFVLANLPHNADVVNACAFGLGHVGLLDEAEQLMQRAFFLNPFPPSDYHADHAVLLALRGEHEAAEEHFAVSGETGLLYSAVRIANASHLEDGLNRVARMVNHFIASFRAAWQPASEPAVSDALEWICQIMPLHPAANMAWLSQRLRRMLKPSWPAARESGQ